MKSMEYMRKGAKEGLQEKIAGRKIKGKQKMLGKAISRDYPKGKAT